MVVHGPDKRRRSTTRTLADGECKDHSALLDKLKEVRAALLMAKPVAPPPPDTSTPSGAKLDDAVDHPATSSLAPLRRGSRKRRQYDAVNVSHEDAGLSFATIRLAKRDRRKKHHRAYTPKVQHLSRTAPTHSLYRPKHALTHPMPMRTLARTSVALEERWRRRGRCQRWRSGAKARARCSVRRD